MNARFVFVPEGLWGWMWRDMDGQGDTLWRECLEDETCGFLRTDFKEDIFLDDNGMARCRIIETSCREMLSQHRSYETFEAAYAALKAYDEKKAKALDALKKNARKNKAEFFRQKAKEPLTHNPFAGLKR